MWVGVDGLEVEDGVGRGDEGDGGGGDEGEGGGDEDGGEGKVWGSVWGVGEGDGLGGGVGGILGEENGCVGKEGDNDNEWGVDVDVVVEGEELGMVVRWGGMVMMGMLFGVGGERGGKMGGWGGWRWEWGKEGKNMM